MSMPVWPVWLFWPIFDLGPCRAPCIGSSISDRTCRSLARRTRTRICHRRVWPGWTATHSPTAKGWERLPWTWKRGTGASICACLWALGNTERDTWVTARLRSSRHLPPEFWAMLSKSLEKAWSYRSLVAFARRQQAQHAQPPQSAEHRVRQAHMQCMCLFVPRSELRSRLMCTFSSSLSTSSSCTGESAERGEYDHRYNLNKVRAGIDTPRELSV